MIGIPDDPIVSSIERTGYPPWIDDSQEETEFDGDDSRQEGERMKGVYVTTDNQVEIREMEVKDGSMLACLQNLVGGYIEIVHPMGLGPPLVMIVNEEGLLHDLRKNDIGCLLYGTHIHGAPIVGNVVILKIGMTEDGPDLVGLDDNEANEVAATLVECIKPRH